MKVSELIADYVISTPNGLGVTRAALKIVNSMPNLLT
jgi:hypothetical protein